VRRLLVVGAVTLIVLTAAIVTQENPRIAEAGAAEQATATSGITSSNAVSVVAVGSPVRALALDSRSVIYLTNAAAPNQIFAVDRGAATSSQITAVAGIGTSGSLGDGGAATAAQFELNSGSLAKRSGLAVALDGTLYVADTGNATVRTIAGPSSTEPGVIRSVVGRWAAPQNVTVVAPMGIALDRTGNLYVADYAAGAVLVMPAATGRLQILAHVLSPASIAVSSNGERVYVASPDTGGVFAINAQTQAIEAVAGFQPATSSQSSLTASPCATPAKAATTSSTAEQICPAGLAVDPTGNVFISDANSGRILRVDAKTTATTVFASGLKQPGEIAFDASGNLYAAEQGLNRIVAFAQVGTSQGSLSLTPTSASYGDTPVGGATAAQSFTLSNISSSPVTGLTIPKATTPADFTVQTNSCVSTLTANSSCTLTIAFTATTTGARSDTLTVTDSNASDLASTVLSGAGDDYQMALASNQLMSISVQAGDAATFHLEIVPDNVFSGTVTLVCPGNLPTNTTCTFSPTTVSVTAGMAAPFSVTFQTTGIVNPLSTTAPPTNTSPLCPQFPFPLLLAAVAVLLLLPALGISSWRLAAHTFAIFAFAACAMVMIAGCKKGPTNASIGATPAGTSTMAVTGNSQGASRAVTITLNVVQE
jgi:sugar lactone lactonase YvrE